MFRPSLLAVIFSIAVAAQSRVVNAAVNEVDGVAVEVPLESFSVEVQSRSEPTSSSYLTEVKDLTAAHIFDYVSDSVSARRAEALSHAQLSLTSFDVKDGVGVKGRPFHSLVASFDGYAVFREQKGPSRERLYKIQTHALGREGRLLLLDRLRQSPADAFLQDAYKITVEVDSFGGDAASANALSNGTDNASPMLLPAILAGVMAFIGVSLITIGCVCWKKGRRNASFTPLEASTASSPTKTVETNTSNMAESYNRDMEISSIDISPQRSVDSSRFTYNPQSLVSSPISSALKDVERGDQPEDDAPSGPRPEKGHADADRTDRPFDEDNDISIARKIGGEEVSIIQPREDGSPNKTMVLPNKTLILAPIEESLNEGRSRSSRGDSPRREPSSADSGATRTDANEPRSVQLRDKLAQMNRMIQNEKRSARYGSGAAHPPASAAAARSELRDNNCDETDVFDDLQNLSQQFGRHRSSACDKFDDDE